MKSINISGLSEEAAIAKLKEQLAMDPESVVAATDNTDNIKGIARAIGGMGYRMEMWPAEGIQLVVFSRLKL